MSAWNQNCPLLMESMYMFNFTQATRDLSADNFTTGGSLPVVRTGDVQRGLDYFAPWLQPDNKQPFILVGPEGCGKG